MTGFGETRHERLEIGAKAVRIGKSKHPAERVVARRTVLQTQELTQEALLFLSEISHIHATLAATQKCAKRDQYQFVQIVPPSIAGARISKLPKALQKPVHAIPQSEKSRSG